MSFFRFKGTPGDQIRFSVTGQSDNLDPAIEVRDPLGSVVLNGPADLAGCVASTFSTCSFSIDYLPQLEGEHSVILYDQATDNSGDYQLTLTCLFSPDDARCENLLGRFGDVPEDYWAFNFIEILADNGVTVGCMGGGS